MEFAASRRLLLLLTAGSYLFIGLLVALSGFRIDYTGLLRDLGVFVTTLVLSVAASRFAMVRLRASVECLGSALLLAIPLLLASYLAAWMRLPLADSQLAKADELLGFDWKAAIAFIDAHPVIANIFNYAYRSFGYQIMLWPVLLSCFGKERRAYEMMSSYAVICLICSLVSMWWPAVGTYIYYDFDGANLQTLDATYGYYFLDQFNGVRDNPDFVWSLYQSAGIVTFPSGHAAMAVVCGWAAWQLKWVRYPALALNVAMAISAVPSGSHYLVDVIAGVLIAVVSIVAVSAIGRQRSYSPSNSMLAPA